ncbi:MAG TPA: winged helix DNA-binding domain-containing protein [Jiangellaceae bacterium]|nr:winged helix DNA-binding domain-containing protein [Jiangellaceae bacterium]
MSGRSLTHRELNRAVLARQGLLEPFDDPLPKVLERVGGIQAQYAPSMYVGLWSRMRRLERPVLTRALEDRTVVQGTLLRSTIHLVSRDDYWPFAVAVRELLREWFLRVSKGNPSATELAAAAERVRSALVDGPLRQAEIDALVGRSARGGMNMVLDLVRIPPSGTWERRKADLHADAESWIGPPDVAAPDARAHLVRRYLGGFGPATTAEIGNWSGLPVRTVTESLKRIDHVTHEADDGATLVDLPDAPLPDAGTPAPIRFLPTWDAVLLVHARRSRILPEEHRPKVFSSRNPHSVPTFLVDGAVAGSWRFVAGRIDLTEFDALPRGVRRQVERAARDLAAFHA